MKGERHAVALSLLLVSALPVLAQTPLHVGRVTVRPLDVYSSAEATRGSFYRLADRLHIETRREVIEQFLLFHEGDVYRPERLQETERNLRALSFLKSASVIASAPHDGVVDVTVTTQDSWSIAPETQAGSRGGQNTFGATIADTNFLGYGKDVEVGWSHGIQRDSLAFNYNDPAFFAPYWHAHMEYVITSDGFSRRLNLGRPFYSFSAPWASLLSITDYRRDDRLYGSGVEVSRFTHAHKEATASYGLALEPADRSARRLVGGIRAIDDDFAPIAGRTLDTPSAHTFRYLFVRYESATNDFIKLNFINKDLRYEDFNLGRQYSLEAAVSPRAFSLPTTTGFVCLTAADGSHAGDNAFLLGAVTAASRVGGGLQNTIATANATFVKRWTGDHPRAFVAKVALNEGWHLDRENQFFADGLTGLRGYRVYAFAGSRSMVVNLEQRLYLGREVLQLASPGVVAFVDAGDATDRGFSLKSDVGIGIRVGLPRTPKNLLRVDLAYPLQQDALGRRRLLLSVSSGQAF